MTRKIKVALSVCAVVGIAGFWGANRSLVNFAEALEAHTFTDYVSGRYFPESRKNSGKWPQNLDGLKEFLAKANEGKRGEIVERQYETRLKKFEMIRQDSRQILYRLTLKNYEVVCFSSLEEDESYCDYR